MPTAFLSIHHKWAILFGCWLLFLTGIFANFVGSPGILQWMRLRNLYSLKQDQLTHLNDELSKLQMEASQLSSNRIAQEKEIRRVLGYASADEIIFDFTPSNQF
jgi:cell division protein FtsB